MTTAVLERTTAATEEAVRHRIHGHWGRRQRPGRPRLVRLPHPARLDRRPPRARPQRAPGRPHREVRPLHCQPRRHRRDARPAQGGHALSIINNALTDADREVVATYLRENGYDDVDAWARDSDYLLTDEGWVDLDDHVIADIEVQCFHAIEAAGEAQDEQRYAP